MGKKGLSAKEIAEVMPLVPATAEAHVIFNITSQVYAIVYCKDNNTVYFTDDYVYVKDFLIYDLEIDEPQITIWG